VNTTKTEEKKTDRKIAVASGQIKNGTMVIGNMMHTSSWKVK